MEIKLQDDGHAIVLPEDSTNIDLLWKSLDVGVNGDYALLVNHDEGDEVQVWKMSDGCPDTKIWDSSDQLGYCDGSTVQPTPGAGTGSPTCIVDDFTVLMHTYDRGHTFAANDYALTVLPEGNFQVTVADDDDDDDTVLYDNGCYCTDTDNCNMEIKLQDDGHAIVLPEDSTNIDLLWKSLDVGVNGDYALLVNHDEGDEVQVWKMSDGCPDTKIWDSSDQLGYCDGSTVQPTSGAGTEPTTETDPPGCSLTDFTILMLTYDRSSSFTSADYTLTVHAAGNLVVQDTSDNSILFDNVCWCPGHNCNDLTMEAKLQNDGHLIVLPEGHNNVDLLWKSHAVGAIGEYALLVNHEDNDHVQVWNMVDNCPKFNVWDGDAGVCDGTLDPL